MTLKKEYNEAFKVYQEWCNTLYSGETVVVGGFELSVHRNGRVSLKTYKEPLGPRIYIPFDFNFFYENFYFIYLDEKEATNEKEIITYETHGGNPKKGNKHLPKGPDGKHPKAWWG